MHLTKVVEKEFTASFRTWVESHQLGGKKEVGKLVNKNAKYSLV